MKRKYKNITIPYYHYDKKENYAYYIYDNKKYYKLNELFKDFIDYELTYHIEINNKEKILHNITDVIELLLIHPKTFKIPKNYYEEYSTDELSYINKLQKQLINKEIKFNYEPSYDYKFRLKDIFIIRDILHDKEIFNEYKNIILPKKIYSKLYKHEYFVTAGFTYENVIRALDQVYSNSFYYQYGGPNRENYYNHFHAHEFSEVINDLFNNFNEFKIHKFQEEYFSKQELELIKKLYNKLKLLNYKNIIREYKESDYEEYCYLKDNKKYIQLFFHNLKEAIKDIIYYKEKLKSHKI